MTCQSCGRPLVANARFCAACGAPTADACRNCGATLPAGARFCAACGAPTGEAPPSVSGSAAPTRERKVATIVFADIVGFTSMTEGHDPELVQAMVSGAFERLSAEVARYEGLIEKFAGDAMLALFGVPQAHEDDPERAVRAALEMQAAMSDHALELKSRGRPELQLRIGIETGEVLVDLGRVGGERDRLVTGDPVNTAARLQAVAAPGSIVVGPRTYAATRDLVEYEELESFELKGKALPVPGWRAVRVKARRGGLRTPLGLEAPLIGRDEELGLAKDTVRRVTAEGRPHLLTVIGAAGVGKSRLTWELEKYLDGLPETFHWRKGRYLSYGQASFGGLIEVVRSDAGVREDDTEAAAQARLAERLGILGLADDEAITRALGVLLGSASEAAASRDELFEAWRRFLEAIARAAPLVLVLEDIHWADEGSLDFLDFLARWAEAPILVLCLARHELLERRPGWGGGVANSASIVLAPLAPTENAALLDALLPGSLPTGFKDRIVAVAEGNPLFSEELVRMLIDRGIARPGRDGWELVTPVDELEIPSSIHGLLAARLDSLPAQEKQVAQAAAVVGRIFWDAVLAHVVAGASSELDRLLRGLRVKELVVARDPSSLTDSREYGFRHVLIRDVAYESVPKSERARKHLEVAHWAEERLAAREEELVELLASHYHSALAYREEAGSGEEELADLRRRVLDYARRAGRRASELWEATAATAWFRVAIEQARRLGLPPLERARISLEYLDVAITSENVEASLVIGREATQLLAPMADSHDEALGVLGRIQAHLAFVIYGTGKAEEARTLLLDALRGVEDGPPTEARARLLWRLGWLTWRAISAADAVPILERALADARAVGAADTERRALHDLGNALEYGGQGGQGLQLLEQSMQMARDAGDQELLLRCYINLPALMANATWEVERGHAIAREGLERARRGGQRFFVTFLASNLAEGLGDEGDLEGAMRLLDEAQGLAAELGDENLISMANGFRAGLLARFGRFPEAVSYWEEAENHGVAEPQGGGREAWFRALLLWQSDPRAAVSRMAQDLAAADNAQLEARQLARMAARTGQSAEVRDSVERCASTGTSRFAAEARWADALLGPPSEDAANAILEVAERYLSIHLLLVAADGFADAAFVADRAGLPMAEGLARRARELYRRCNALPLLPIESDAMPHGESSAAPPAPTQA